MTPIIKIGDTVTLNSGGPPLTVVFVFLDGNIQVTWMNEGCVNSANFPTACVKLIQP